MSKFPQNGVKPCWFMMASGCGSTADWKVVITNEMKPSKDPVIEEVKKIKEEIKVPPNAKLVQGRTKKVGGHSFYWTQNIVADIQASKKIRFSVHGTNDTYICFADEAAEEANKITYVLGGWGNGICSVAWRRKGQPGNRGWHGGPHEQYGYSDKNGLIHYGQDTAAWFEAEWDIPDKDGMYMQISRISDQNGKGK